MEIDEPTDLEYVEDDFKEGEHETLDEEIRQCFPQALTPQDLNLLLPHLLGDIVTQSGDRLLANYRSALEYRTIIKSEPRLGQMLLDGLKHSFKYVWLLSKDLSVSSGCTSDTPVVEFLRPGEYQSKIS